MKKTKYQPDGLEQICLGLIFFVPVLRLFIWKFFKGAEGFEKEDFSNLAVAAVIFVVFLVYQCRRIIRNTPAAANPLDYPLAGFLAISGLSVLHSADFILSLKAFLILCAFVLYFFMLVDLLNTRKRILAFIYLLVICGAIVSAIGVREFIFLSGREAMPLDDRLLTANKSLHYILSHKRICSLFGWPNVLAGFLILMVPVTWALFLYEKGVFKKYFLGLVGGVSSVVLVLTYSLAGVMSLAAGVLAAFAVHYQKQKGLLKDKKIFRNILIFVLISVALIGFVIYKRDYFSTLNRLNPRVQYLYSISSLIQDHPWVGSGLNTFQQVNRPYIFSESGYSSYAHHSYLQIWAETGIFGLIFFLLIFVFLFRQVRQALIVQTQGKDHVVILGFVAGAAGLLIENLFSFSFLKPNISFYWWFFLGMMVAWMNVCSAPHEVRSEGLSPREGIIRGTTFVCGIVSVLVIMWVLKGESFYYQGIRTLKKGDVVKALALFENAKSSNPLDGRFYSIVGNTYYSIYKKTRDRQLLEKAHAEFVQAIGLTPVVYGNYLYLSRIYWDLGQKNRSREYLEKTVRLAPYFKI